MKKFSLKIMRDLGTGRAFKFDRQFKEQGLKVLP